MTLDPSPTVILPQFQETVVNPYYTNPSASREFLGKINEKVIYPLIDLRDSAVIYSDYYLFDPLISRTLYIAITIHDKCSGIFNTIRYHFAKLQEHLNAPLTPLTSIFSPKYKIIKNSSSKAPSEFNENSTNNSIIKEKQSLRRDLYHIQYRLSKAAAKEWGANARSFGFRIHDDLSYHSEIPLPLPRLRSLRRFYSEIFRAFGTESRAQRQFDLVPKEKPIVHYVAPDSTRDQKRALEVGDQILEVNGESVIDARHASLLLKRATRLYADNRNEFLELKVLRGGNQQTIKLDGELVHHIPVSMHTSDSFQATTHAIGYISISSGILSHFKLQGRQEEREKKLKSDSTLSYPPSAYYHSSVAYFMAHNMAHILRKHHWRSLHRTLFTSLFTPVMRFLGDLYKGINSMHSQGGISCQFGIGFEEEADVCALSLLKEAGFDPSVAQKYWERLPKETLKMTPGIFWTFFSSELSLKDRLNNFETILDNLSTASTPSKG